MICLTLDEIAQATQGYLVRKEDGLLRIDAVVTDTRHMVEKSLFIALKGKQFDAHYFLDNAIASGAKALLVEKESAHDIPMVVVTDTRLALGALSAYVRHKMQKLVCIAITGSNGKTTCKELLSSVLRIHCKNENALLATKGNFNNDIGVPLTLLRLTEKTRFAVLELGANHPGEIAYTAQLVQAKVALINNVMAAHLQGFGSLGGVAKSKGEIWRYLLPKGTGVVNLDAEFSECYLAQLKEQGQLILTFSQVHSQASLYADEICFDEQGNASFILHVKTPSCTAKQAIHLKAPGHHNVSNALAVASMAIALGCTLADIAKGLETFQSVSGRVARIAVDRLITVIDDTYNANSASVIAAVNVLCANASEHVLILSDMGELGKHTELEHKKVGEYAASQSVKLLLAVGPHSIHTVQAFNVHCSRQQKAQHFANKAQLQNFIKKYLDENKQIITLLVKGSRSAKMEDIVTFIQKFKT
ncbi:UDP-N-acetylmuramoyl-tripeptide--D-alanyl-D-alanine ligase [Psychromonas sp. CD1]|uniref:UDP-N-acetylmuramoyl-tripeptide--D-alanyl-D- alanine ligase n=1 Tax=Psychromonas sp. CD1 TaxID=1979839 RepID=UPI000B9BF5D7|nr:UDP-N-acetylmuramoyl-tripeptide--D-alanyl-D-alanine ligase [Psychromonas sp. CD1]